MTVYVTDYGDFTTKVVNGFEIFENVAENPMADGIYCVIGSVQDELVEIYKFGVVFNREYISKENFCEKINKKVERDSALVFRLMNESANGFAKLGEDNEDLVITKKIRDIK